MRIGLRRLIVLGVLSFLMLGIAVAGARLTTTAGGARSAVHIAWPTAASPSKLVNRPVRLAGSARPATGTPARRVDRTGALPVIVLHMHGNPNDDAGCTGSGAADIIACGGPFLKTTATLGTGPAGHWEPSSPALNGANPRTIHDPNWIWNVSGPTSIANTTMTVRWWASCGACGPTGNADWNIRLFVDNTTGALTTANVIQRVRATPSTPNTAELLTATVAIPATVPTITSTLVLHIDPVFADTQENTHIYYDSADLPCPTAVATSGPCDSTVTFDPNAPPPPPPPPTPTYTSGNIGFGPATVVDYQRTEGEPLLHVDKNGNQWETGPWGFSTAQSFVHRSTDGGDQFNVVSPIALRPQSPPGGGDSTIVTDDQGFTYFGDLEGALTELDCSVSNDNGNVWKKNPACVPRTGTDRQWLAVDNGLTSAAADNTIFYAYHNVATGHELYSSPGSTGTADLSGGLVFTNAGAGPTSVMYGGGGNCGKLVFDPLLRNLYYPCGAGNHVDITVTHVNPGQRTGLAFTTFSLPPSPGGTVSNLFPLAAVDSNGNVYLVWSDTGNHQIYYSYSTNEGKDWSQAVQVSQAPANSNVFAWAEAGTPGKLVAVWLGNDSTTLSDNMPNWASSASAANGFPFFGYVGLITGANTLTPNVEQDRFTEKPMHYGQICNSGIGCTLQMPQGDRTMADFLSVNVASDGAIQIMYNDTTSQHHGAHLYEERQLTGPTPRGTTLSKTAPTSPVSDPMNDAQYPHYSPTGPGSNQDQLDFTGFAVNQQAAGTLRVRMTVKNLAGLNTTGKPSEVWITRFQALSNADTAGAQAYRIFYVGAECDATCAQNNPITPTFFAGSPSTTGPPPGCTTTTPGNCKVLQYPQEIAAATGGVTGTVVSNTLCIDLPLSVFGAGRPIASNATLYNVAAFTAGRHDSVTDVYADVDSTKSFDFPLGTTVATPCSQPTAVRILSFGAHAGRGGVVIHWQSATEAGVAGFNVYRGSVKLNRSLIAARGSAAGGSYTFVDRAVRRPGQYTYRLQIVGRDGTRSWSASARTYMR